MTMPMPERYAQIKRADPQAESSARGRLSDHRNDRGYRNDSADFLAELLHNQAP
ncbi:MAG TPA: hypothetical protein VL976_06345 [Xanthobacteraceae bacterium]|nr:hypothetical protein [Xanthobacteraceae bacterium]